MANNAATLKLAIQTLYTDTMNKPEMRTGRKPIVALGLKNLPLMVSEQEIIAMRESTRRPVQLGSLISPTFTKTSTRVSAHTGPVGDTAIDQLVWGTKAVAFAHVDSQFDDNIMGAAKSLQNQFRKAIDEIMSDIETAGASFIETNKSGVNINNDLLGTWNGTTDAFEIALADANNFFWAGRDNMEQNKYSPMYDVIADNYIYSLGANLSNQGGGNATNYGYQFDEFNLGLSNELTTGTNKGVSYWIQEGAFCLNTWIPKGNRDKRGLGEWDYLTTFNDPRYPGIDFALSIRKARTDESSNNGNIQSFRAEFELSLDYTYNLAPLSVANETVIQAVNLLAT